VRVVNICTDFVPYAYILHEFGELDEIESLLENSEADVYISNSHRAHGGRY
jgi:hypothetical protein